MNEIKRLQQNIDNLKKVYTNDFLLENRNLLRKRSFEWFDKRFAPKPGSKGLEKNKKEETFTKIRNVCQTIQKEIIATIQKCQNFETFTKSLKKPIKHLQNLQWKWYENEFELKEQITPSPEPDTKEKAQNKENAVKETNEINDEANEIKVQDSVLGTRTAQEAELFASDTAPPAKKRKLAA